MHQLAYGKVHTGTPGTWKKGVTAEDQELGRSSKYVGTQANMPDLEEKRHTGTAGTWMKLGGRWSCSVAIQLECGTPEQDPK